MESTIENKQYRGGWNPEILKDLMSAAGMNYKVLSENSGIPRNTLRAYIENKCSPSIAVIIKLAGYFAIPADVLLGRYTEQEYKDIMSDYHRMFTELRTAPYEAYLKTRLKEDGSSEPGKIDDADIEAPWPYNLLDDVTKARWPEVIGDDQAEGIMLAVRNLQERLADIVLKYYRDGISDADIAREYGLTRSRIGQLKAGALRNLRHPALYNLLVNGKDGSKEADRLRDEKAEAERLKQEALNEQEKARQLMSLVNDYAEASNTSVKQIQVEQMKSSTALDDIGLSVRSYNCLRRAGAKNVADVIEIIESGKLMTIRNLGKKSADEIVHLVGELTGKKYVA